jgi:hypothetical protein
VTAVGAELYPPADGYRSPHDNGVAQSARELNAVLPVCVPAPSLATPTLASSMAPMRSTSRSPEPVSAFHYGNARPLRSAHSHRIGDGLAALDSSTSLAMSQDADASASRRNRITRAETSSFDQIA